MNDAFLVTCPGENAYLDATGTEWVRARTAAGTFPRDRALELSLAVEWPFGRRHVSIFPTSICGCCGRHPHQANLKLVDNGLVPQWRCDQHVGRNPCAVEGCRRTCEEKRPRLDGYLCGRHWRVVPKPMKLVYSRIWRLQKKSGGWTNTLAFRHNRIWSRIVELARNCARGGCYVDLAQIEREFGL